MATDTNDDDVSHESDVPQNSSQRWEGEGRSWASSNEIRTRSVTTFSNSIPACAQP